MDIRRRRFSGLFLALCASFFLLVAVASTGWAGNYSDYHSNRSSGQTSSSMTLKYGGTYSGAGQNYMNYRYGYGTGQNTHYYSPQGVPGYTPQPMTPQQRRDMNKAMQEADDLMNRIQNDPTLWR